MTDRLAFPESAVSLLADAVLLLHLGVVCFVVGGLGAVVVGNLLGWRWVNRWWFRVAHLGAIAFVVLQAWLGATCPLTSLERWLREQAHGVRSYQGGFIEHWVGTLLFYQAPLWVFTVAYTVFGALVIASWVRWPPRR
jgi:hypothetical protein